MATLSAGSTTSVSVAVGETLRISGNAEVSVVAGITTSVSGAGSFGPFGAITPISVKAISNIQYSSELEETSRPLLFLDSNGDAQGIRNKDGTATRFQGVAQYYKFFIPGQQFIGSGDAKDKSGNAADATRLASLTDAAAWANPGYITSGAGANFGLTIPVAKFSFDLASQSVILSFRLKKVGPVGSESIIGCGDAAAAQGFYLSMRAASGSVSKIRPILNTSGGVVSGLADSLATFGEAAATDHVVTLAIDGITKGVFLYCDGTLSNSYTAAFTGGTTIANAFGIGSNTGNVGATSVAGQFSGIHFLVFDGVLPANIGIIAQKLSANPHVPLSDFDMEF